MTSDNNSIDKDLYKLKRLSIDTNDSTSSRFSGPPPSGTYVIELPKNQIFRTPPPENAHRYEYLSKRKPNRTSCRNFLAATLILLVIVVAVIGVLYLIYQPQKPRFSVTGFSVTGINLTSSSRISPLVKANVRSRNGNGKLGLIYVGGVSEVFYNGVKLGYGEFTAFKQPVEDVKVVMTELKGLGIQLTSGVRKELTELEKRGKVPFDLRIEAPVKFKVGVVTTWTMTVKVDCKVTVDKLTASGSVVTESCDTGLSLL